MRQPDDHAGRAAIFVAAGRRSGGAAIDDHDRFWRARARGQSLQSVPIDKQTEPVYKGWLKTNEKLIVYSEPSGQWFINSDLYWQMAEKYHDRTVGEKSGWAAAENPLPGECEGYIGCELYLVTATYGKYLEL